MFNPYEAVMLRLARTEAGGRIFLGLANRVDKKLLRWTKGRISSGIGTRHGRSIGLLTSTGAKSGEPREAPLLFTRDGDALILIASRGGTPKNPAWYYNLKATPRCTVDFGGAHRTMLATVTRGDERDRCWALAVANYPGYTDYQLRVDRQIPVIRLVDA